MDRVTQMLSLWIECFSCCFQNLLVGYTFNSIFLLSSSREKPEQSGHDTVGCAALDTFGHTACATSTGGITAKMPGRVGDTPILGAGGYADDQVCITIFMHALYLPGWMWMDVSAYSSHTLLKVRLTHLDWCNINKCVMYPNYWENNFKYLEILCILLLWEMYILIKRRTHCLSIYLSSLSLGAPQGEDHGRGASTSPSSDFSSFPRHSFLACSRLPPVPVQMFNLLQQVGAVSTTGHGESLMKVCLARHIIDTMATGVCLITHSLHLSLLGFLSHQFLFC